MKAVVMQGAALSIQELADPEPGPGEALVKTLACGICGSDLHMLHQCDDVLSGFQRGGMPLDFDSSAGVVFECVGVPGMIQQAIAGGPPKFTRVVVVGVCMQSDTIEPIVGLGREMNIHWAFGYTGEEFGDTLHGLADGRIEAEGLITSSVGPEGVEGAFEALGDPESEVKVMIKFGKRWRRGAE